RDDVHERAALLAGEDALVHGGGKLLLAQNHSGTGAAQRLVGGGSNKLRVGHGRRMDSGGHESGEVRHVDHENRADFVGDLSHARKVEDARIGAASADDDLGFFGDGNGLKLVVVDGFGVF